MPEKILIYIWPHLLPFHAAANIIRSQEMKRRFGLLSNDSLTLQIMEDMEIMNLASNDADFEMVNFIKLYKPSVSVESAEE